MKALKIIGIVLVVLLGLYVIAAVVAPATLVVEKSTVINAPASSVYSNVVCFKNWEPWNPWDAMDPTTENEYSGEECGVGAIYSWNGEKTGTGTQNMVEVRENEYIKTTLVFGGTVEPQTSEWFFEETDEGTKVTWNYIGTETSFFSKPGNLMGQIFLGKAYESGLAALKQVVETSPAPAMEASIDIQEIETEETKYLLITDEVEPTNIAMYFAENFPKIMGYAQENGASMAGSPTGIYFTWTDTLTKMAAAIPVDKEVAGNDEIEYRVIPAGNALRVDHYGNYDEVGPAHYAMEEYANEKGYSLSFAIETYVTDPEEEPDTSKWLTQITYPIGIE
jgi:effector-binding domain-containing protein